MSKRKKTFELKKEQQQELFRSFFHLKVTCEEEGMPEKETQSLFRTALKLLRLGEIGEFMKIISKILEILREFLKSK
ncbi:MAG: hypothetical protein C4527_28790 [Candidatus Omnitrophota bacterium]|jgi:hypothetical protein|nr:MAG: hypothetical protein C4527_28790 [Candidatus Omnitrophota bacterium]